VFIKKANLPSGGMTSPRGGEGGGIGRSSSATNVSNAGGHGGARQPYAAELQKQGARAEAYVPIPPERVLLWYCARIVLASPDKRNTQLQVPNGGRGFGGVEPPQPQAALLGGAMAFHPLSLADAVRLVGGPNVLLVLIADAQNGEELGCTSDLLCALLPPNPGLTTREFESLGG
jgi:hypothetical protein